jgi:hypothetical protein
VKPGKNIELFGWIRLDSFPIATPKMETLSKHFVNYLPKCLVLLKRKHIFNNVCSTISVLGSLMAKKLFGKIFFFVNYQRFLVYPVKETAPVLYKGMKEEQLLLGEQLLQNTALLFM